ncbi:MAG: glyoxalase superfamily protein [Rhodospirillaceae bacterium]|nr:glyoxalase superfamily protein [Rhodospirillaceae bacterium]
MSQSPDIAFNRSTPVLRSADYPRSRAFFADQLGFDVVEEGGEPPRFGIFKRGKAFFFVDAWHGGPVPSPTVWSAYVHVAELQALHDSYAAAGVEISRPVEETVYGMREFEVTDPEGNVICFGEDIEPTP